MIRPSAQRITEFNGVLIVVESARPLSACSHGIIARRDVVSWLLEWLMGTASVFKALKLAPSRQHQKKGDGTPEEPWNNGPEWFRRGQYISQ